MTVFFVVERRQKAVMEALVGSGGGFAGLYFFEEAAGVADLFVVEGAVGGGANGNEDKAEAEAGDEDGEEKGGGGDVEGNVAEVEGGEAEGEEAEGEQVARIYFV